LLEVVALDARGHEEALDEAQEAGDAGPAEEQVEYAEAVAAEVEVVEAEAAQEEGEQDAGDLVLFDCSQLGVEDGLLLVRHAGGHQGYGRHCFISFRPFASCTLFLACGAKPGWRAGLLPVRAVRQAGAASSVSYFST
jgi:hypothetical protein